MALDSIYNKETSEILKLDFKIREIVQAGDKLLFLGNADEGGVMRVLPVKMTVEELKAMITQQDIVTGESNKVWMAVKDWFNKTGLGHFAKRTGQAAIFAGALAACSQEDDSNKYITTEQNLTTREFQVEDLNHLGTVQELPGTRWTVTAGQNTYTYGADAFEILKKDGYIHFIYNVYDKIDSIDAASAHNYDFSISCQDIADCLATDLRTGSKMVNVPNTDFYEQNGVAIHPVTGEAWSNNVASLTRASYPVSFSETTGELTFGSPTDQCGLGYTITSQPTFSDESEIVAPNSDSAQKYNINTCSDQSNIDLKHGAYKLFGIDSATGNPVYVGAWNDDGDGADQTYLVMVSDPEHLYGDDTTNQFTKTPLLDANGQKIRGKNPEILITDDGKMLLFFERGDDWPVSQRGLNAMYVEEYCGNSVIEGAEVCENNDPNCDGTTCAACSVGYHPEDKICVLDNVIPDPDSDADAIDSDTTTPQPDATDPDTWKGDTGADGADTNGPDTGPDTIDLDTTTKPEIKAETPECQNLLDDGTVSLSSVEYEGAPCYIDNCSTDPSGPGSFEVHGKCTINAVLHNGVGPVELIISGSDELGGEFEINMPEVENEEPAIGRQLKGFYRIVQNDHIFTSQGIEKGQIVVEYELGGQTFVLGLEGTIVEVDKTVDSQGISKFAGLISEGFVKIRSIKDGNILYDANLGANDRFVAYSNVADISLFRGEGEDTSNTDVGVDTTLADTSKTDTSNIAEVGNKDPNDPNCACTSVVTNPENKSDNPLAPVAVLLGLGIVGILRRENENS